MNKNIIYFLLISILSSSCVPDLKQTVLVNMIDKQEKFFKDEIIAPFIDYYKTNINVIHYSFIDSLPANVEEMSGQNLSLIKVPFEKSRELVDRGDIVSLEDILSPERLKEFLDIYLLTELGSVNGKHYFIPRKFETRIMVYRKSKVTDALALFEKYRKEINTDLKKYNTYGLPSNFRFEDNPNQWDYYDIFVVGWIWAHTIYKNRTVGRIAHRGKYYSGTAHRIIDRVFQCMGDSSDVVSLSGSAVADAFQWESLYAVSGVYNRKMWTEKWSGSDIWKGFASGDIFISFMTQLDCFFIHGTDNDGLTGYIDDKDDLAFALMPKGCSVELNSQGLVKRDGRKTITTGGWWWAIPKASPDKMMSFDLATFITSFKNQVQGCSRFGMIPVRKDVLSDMQLLFGGDWKSDVYDVSFKQLVENGYTTVPTTTNFKSIEKKYLDAFFDIVVGCNFSVNKEIPNYSYILDYIGKTYSLDTPK